jgi:hypothetical protein
MSRAYGYPEVDLLDEYREIDFSIVDSDVPDDADLEAIELLDDESLLSNSDVPDRVRGEKAQFEPAPALTREEIMRIRYSQEIEAPESVLPTDSVDFGMPPHSESTPEVRDMTNNYDRAAMAWIAKAACLGSGIEKIFPGRGELNKVDAIKAVCSVCPVREDCLEYAIVNAELFGIWGGMTEMDRRKMRRQYNKQKRTANTVTDSVDVE